MKVKTTYLQMFARPERVVPPQREGRSVLHAKNPTVAYYLDRGTAAGSRRKGKAYGTVKKAISES
jgi:hypothetical protein